VTTTKPAAKTRSRPTLGPTSWTANYEEIIESIRTNSLTASEVPVAGAFACALVARSLLNESAHNYFSRLLHAARGVVHALPDDAGLTDAVRQILAAADRADGLANGPECVVEAIEAEEERISKVDQQ
jgi:hypothetical protein